MTRQELIVKVKDLRSRLYDIDQASLPSRCESHYRKAWARTDAVFPLWESGGHREAVEVLRLAESHERKAHRCARLLGKRRTK